jgi:alcohol dehydrogenase, propanol-preferring
LIKDEWAAFGLAMKPETKGIAGHEGAGVVVAVGDDQHHRWKVGDRAGIKWVASTCGECEFCTNGPNQKNSGFSAAGTFQEYALADGRYTTRIPDGVSDEEAGPIMCGGVTAYVACKRSAVKPGQWIARIFLLISSACADSSRSFPVQGVGWVISPYSMQKPWSAPLYHPESFAF